MEFLSGLWESAWRIVVGTDEETPAPGSSSRAALPPSPPAATQAQRKALLADRTKSKENSTSNQANHADASTAVVSIACPDAQAQALASSVGRTETGTKGAQLATTLTSSEGGVPSNIETDSSDQRTPMGVSENNSPDDSDNMQTSVTAPSTPSRNENIAPMMEGTDALPVAVAMPSFMSPQPSIDARFARRLHSPHTPDSVGSSSRRRNSARRSRANLRSPLRTPRALRSQARLAELQSQGAAPMALGQDNADSLDSLDSPRMLKAHFELSRFPSEHKHINESGVEFPLRSDVATAASVPRPFSSASSASSSSFSSSISTSTSNSSVSSIATSASFLSPSSPSPLHLTPSSSPVVRASIPPLSPFTPSRSPASARTVSMAASGAAAVGGTVAAGGSSTALPTGDRFIPSRAVSNLAPRSAGSAGAALHGAELLPESNHSRLLRNELLPAAASGRAAAMADSLGGGVVAPASVVHSGAVTGGPRPLGASTTAAESRTLQFASPRRPPLHQSPARAVQAVLDSCSLTYSSAAESKALLSPPPSRKFPRDPIKILDAPGLLDDFYLNLLDWSSQNVVAVGLGRSAYVWNARTCKVTKVCEMDSSDHVSVVAWTESGDHLCVGTRRGLMQLWDANTQKLVRSFNGHNSRVGSLDWYGNSVASGGRDRLVLLHDARQSTASAYGKHVGHKQEVCGIQWSPDGHHIASGGNDNKLIVWRPGNVRPVHTFSEHVGAVKALAWSPHQHGLLASGGGTADRHIRFYNTRTFELLSAVDTGSQVCNLAWSKPTNELVSTHGYSLNQIMLWRYPGMQKLVTLTGHTYRVLYLAMSPDGQTIVSGAGDETLRFWNLFPSAAQPSTSALGTRVLFPSASVR